MRKQVWKKEQIAYGKKSEALNKWTAKRIHSKQNSGSKRAFELVIFFLG